MPIKKPDTTIHFVDLASQQARIKDKIDAGIQRVLAHGKYIMGPEVFELEERLANYVGVKHCISCASGTDALLMSLMAQGVGPGDAIFTTPFTFVATGEVISLLGATPVFVDIDPRTFNIDPQKLGETVESVYRESSIGLRETNSQPLTPKGIIPVDLFGLPADYDAINVIADKYGLFVLEDAAQSFGGMYKGRKAGSLADVAATSFFPAKPLGCYGDGGAVFTDDYALADILRSIRNHGKGEDKYDNVRIGISGRLDTLQAAILLPKLEIFPEEVENRQKVAAAYTRMFSELNDQRSTIKVQQICTPFIPSGQTSAWAQYSILLASNKQRIDLQKHLSDSGIPTAIYYPKPLHLQTTYAGLRYEAGDFAIAEDVAQKIVSLPMGPYLREEEQEMVASSVIEGRS